jgi:hypothetical protein
MLPIVFGQTGSHRDHRERVFALNGPKIPAIEALPEAISRRDTAIFAAADDDFVTVTMTS